MAVVSSLCSKTNYKLLQEKYHLHVNQHFTCHFTNLLKSLKPLLVRQTMAVHVDERQIHHNHTSLLKRNSKYCFYGKTSINFIIAGEQKVLWSSMAKVIQCSILKVTQLQFNSYFPMKWYVYASTGMICHQFQQGAQNLKTNFKNTELITPKMMMMKFTFYEGHEGLLRWHA